MSPLPFLFILNSKCMYIIEMRQLWQQILTFCLPSCNVLYIAKEKKTCHENNQTPHQPNSFHQTKLSFLLKCSANSKMRRMNFPLKFHISLLGRPKTIAIAIKEKSLLKALFFFSNWENV